MTRLRLPLILLLVLLAAAVALERYAARPEVVLLRGGEGARWVMADLPFELRARPGGEAVTVFRAFLEAGSVPAEATLRLRALRRATVYLGGQAIFETPGGSEDWQRTHEIPLGGRLGGERVELAVAVRHTNGPPALWARCEELGLATPRGWMANVGGGWSPVRPAVRRPVPELSAELPSGPRALMSRAWVLLLSFALAFGLTLAHQRGRSPLPSATGWIARPGNLRWLLVGLWVVLAANNFWRIPREVGFDVPFHLAYMRHIVETRSLPLATDGWQMFQAPLYYLLSALPFGLLSKFLELHTVEKLLRWIPLACGLLQVLLAHRALRHVFPEREDLQSMGLLLAGLLPVNLYMSQVVGNEPLAALLSAGALVLLLGMLREPRRATAPRALLSLGLVLGAAILSKVTAVLLLPAALLVPLLVTRERAWASRLRAGTLVLLTVLVVSGWFFARNWVELGTPFVFSSGNVSWWQDPGYRVPEHFATFGRALFHPAFAGSSGLWDALYSTFWLDGQMSSMVAREALPPWNLSFVLAGGLLALPLGLTIGVGAVVGLQRRRPAALLAVGCLALYLLALAQQYLALPIYSTGKASYTLGLLPLYAVLFAMGMDAVLRGAIGKAVGVGLLVGWGVFAYLGYFVG